MEEILNSGLVPLNDWLVARRLELGLEVKALARKAGISSPHLSCLERGEYFGRHGAPIGMNDRTLRGLAKGLEVDLFRLREASRNRYVDLETIRLPDTVREHMGISKRLLDSVSYELDEKDLAIAIPFGTFIKCRRQQVGHYTVADLARLVGCSLNYIYQIEKGKKLGSQLSEALLVKLSMALKTNTAVFVKAARAGLVVADRVCLLTSPMGDMESTLRGVVQRDGLMLLGEFVKKRRKQLGMSTGCQLAQAAGICTSLLYRVESQVGVPSKRSASSICRLSVPLRLSLPVFEQAVRAGVVDPELVCLDPPFLVVNKTSVKSASLLKVLGIGEGISPRVKGFLTQLDATAPFSVSEATFQSLLRDSQINS